MFAVLSFAVLLAQDTGRHLPTLELRSVYETAARDNQRIAAANALAAAARAGVASASRPPDPQVQIGAMNYALPQWRAMDVVGMTQLQAMQMLPLAGKLRLAGRAAGFAADADQERAYDTRWEIHVKVAMAFYDLYVADQSLAIDRETTRVLEDVRRVAEAMYRVGDGRQTDVLRAQVEIARMAQDTLRMASMRIAARSRLSALLTGAVVDGAPVLPSYPDSTPALNALIAAASAGRPTLHAGQLDVEAAKSRSALAQREVWPDLTVAVQYAQRSGMDGAERMASVMVGATLPVFARSRQLRMRDEASAMRQMVEADLRAMQAETVAAVAEAHANLVRARTLIAMYRETLLPQAEAVTQSATASYRVGRVDFMTLLDSRMNVNRYRKELVALQAEEGSAWAELEMLTGRELFSSRSDGKLASAWRMP